MKLIIFRKTLNLIITSSFFIVGPASATMVNFTDNGYNNNLGHSFTETDANGMDVSVSAFYFSGSNSSPSSSGVNNSFSTAYGSYGMGIGSGGNPQHSAENSYQHREFFLIEFEHSVQVESASISEWGNTYRQYGGDSDVEYWGGTGVFDWDNLGTLFQDNVSASALSNGQTRQINFDNDLGNISWLLLGPEAYDENSSSDIPDFIKLRKITYTAAVVPVPGAIWLMGSALFGLISYRGKNVP